MNTPEKGCRIKIAIGAPIATRGDVTIRPVSIRRGNNTFGARCYFRVVNGGAVYSIGECSDNTFDQINHAFEARGAKAIAQLLGAM